MRFSEPARLLLLVLPLALVAAYVLAQRRRPSYVARFTNLDLLDVVAPERPAWRRHVPAVALVGALVLLVGALARPVRETQVATDRATVMVALDVSLSMEATDVSPTRIEAAKAAAAKFVRSAPSGVRIGLIAFDRNADVLVSPTTDRSTLERAIDGLQLGEGTAIGEAVFAGLDALAADQQADAPTTTAPGGSPAEGATPNDAARIVLMSDGTNTVGRSNDEAAAAAQAAGVPVNTIAFGTPEGSVTYQGETITVPVNGPALEKLATDTGGKYFEAASESELAKVFEGIGSTSVTEPRTVDVSPWFVAVALALLAAAAVGSLAWFSRIP